MTRRRLIFFDFVTHFGGAQQSTVTLLNVLRGHFDIQVWDAYGTCGAYLKALGALDIEVTVLQPGATSLFIGASEQRIKRAVRLCHQMPALFRLARSLREMSAALRPEVVLTNSYKSLALFYLAGLYRCCHVAFYARGWYLRSQVPALGRYLIRRCHGVLAVSSATALALERWGVPKARIHLAPTIMDLEGVMNQARAGLSDSPPHLERPKRIVVPAQLVPSKGQHVALAAARRLRARGQDFVMWLCGDVKMGVGEGYRRRLEETIEAYGLGDHCFLLGHRADLRALVAQAHVLVLPSHTEGLPRAVWEAMLLGCPVVATPVGGIVDLVEDGKTGLLFAPDDAEALAVAIERLLTDETLARTLSRNARAFVLERYAPAETRRMAEAALAAVC